jgi:DNA polymerase alpha subunit B
VQSDLVERGNLGELTAVGVPKQETVVVVGRVACEAAEGRINKASVLLEGSRRDSGGFRVKLDLGELPAFALFPGQVLALCCGF